MHKSATKCNETIGKWCKNKHGASKIIDTFETYHSTSLAHLWLPPNFYVDVRRVVLSICSEGIESGLVAAATTSSPFSLVPGGIRQLRFSFSSSEHARVLAVSLASFSPLSPSVSAAGYVFRRGLLFSMYVR
jgi:hypothetical protein